MRARRQTWIAVFGVVVLGMLAGCAGAPERLPQCRGEAQPINGRSATDPGAELPVDREHEGGR